MHRARTLSPSKKASKFSPTTDDLLLEASNEEDSNLVSSLIKGFQGISSLNVNAKNSFGSTALHLATFHGKLDNVKELLQVRDVEVNCQDIYLRTPAFFAARNGRKEILQLLLERNADVNIPNKYGETALSKASYYGHEECVRLLLQQKRCQSIPDTIFGNNALHNAAMRGHLSCIQCLVENGKKIGILIDSVNSNGYTGLHLAIIYKQIEAAKLLIRLGANIQTLSKNNQSPLEDATKLGLGELAVLLRKAIIGSQLESLKRKPLSHWSAEDVSQWLTLIDFPQYRDVFLRNHITGTTLTALTVSTLKSELHLASYGHRTSIVASIKKLSIECQQIPSENHWNETFVASNEKISQSPSSSSHSYSVSMISTPILNDCPSPNERIDFKVDCEKEDSFGTIDQCNKAPNSSVSNSFMQSSWNTLDLSVWSIDYSELDVKELIGKGFFGEVRRAKWKGIDVAVKVIYREELDRQKDINRFYRELIIISKLRHPNICNFLGACLHSGNQCIVMEYLPGGNLYTLIHYNYYTLEKSSTLRYEIISDIIKGMTYLHDMKILHRDLTSKNLLLDSNMNCKVGDFGLSRIKEENGEMTAQIGCLWYSAPEVFRGETYSEAADVFSFAMIVYELLSGIDPTRKIPALKFANMVAYENYRPSIPPCTTRWEKLISACWHPEASMRPSFKNLLNEIQQSEPTVFISKSKIFPSETTSDEYVE